jgi:hypothetical protein
MTSQAKKSLSQVVEHTLEDMEIKNQKVVGGESPGWPTGTCGEDCGGPTNGYILSTFRAKEEECSTEDARRRGK